MRQVHVPRVERPEDDTFLPSLQANPDLVAFYSPLYTCTQRDVDAALEPIPVEGGHSYLRSCPKILVRGFRFVEAAAQPVVLGAIFFSKLTAGAPGACREEPLQPCLMSSLVICPCSLQITSKCFSRAP